MILLTRDKERVDVPEDIERKKKGLTESTFIAHGEVNRLAAKRLQLEEIERGDATPSWWS